MFFPGLHPQCDYPIEPYWWGAMALSDSGCTQNLRVNIYGAYTISRKSESFWIVLAVFGDVYLFSQVTRRVAAAVQGQDELILIARLCSH